MPNTTTEIDIESFGKQHRLSSAFYATLHSQATAPLDGLATFFRIVGILDENCISYCAEHHAIFGTYCALNLLFAGWFVNETYKREKIRHDNNSVDYLYRLLSQACAGDIQKIKTFLNVAREKDEELNRTFSDIDISRAGEISVTYTALSLPNLPERATSSPVKKTLPVLWQFFNLCSMTYWVIWMADVLFTGTIASGMCGIPALIAFGIPALIGLIYIALKIANYFRNKPPENPSPQDAIESRLIVKLMQSALMHKKFEDAPNDMQVDLSNSPKQIVARIERKPVLTVAMTGVSNCCTYYILAQFNAWYILDFLKVVCNVTLPGLGTLIGGIALFVIAAIGGTNAAKEKHDQFKKDKATIADKQPLINTMEENYNSCVQATGLTVSKTVPAFNQHQFWSDASRTAPSENSSRNKIANRVFRLIMGIESGIFLVRIFAVKGQAPLLPFIAIVIPYGLIGIAVLMAVVGIIYGLCKLYEYHVKQQSARDHLFLEQLTQRAACLERTATQISSAAPSPATAPATLVVPTQPGQ